MVAFITIKWVVIWWFLQRPFWFERPRTWKPQNQYNDQPERNEPHQPVYIQP